VVLDTAQSARPFVAEIYPEPNLVKPQDLSAIKYGELPNAPSAPASAATNDKASAIQAKPVPDRFRMTGTTEAD
jgi:hypothetical protein